MKKLLTLALAVLGFTAAQALTLDWTEGQGFNLTEASGDITLTIAVVSNGSVKFQDLGNDGLLFSLAGLSLTRKTGNGGAECWIKTADITNKNSGGHTSNDRLNGIKGGVDKVPEGSERITTFTFNFSSYDETDNTWGRLDASVVFANGDSAGDFYNGAYSLAYSDLTSTNEFSAIAGLTLKSASLSGDGVVPEPTVLALLALGVAGVALKRKKVVA